MKKPTAKEIEAQIKALIKIKPKVIPSSFFGDDHHKAIDYQVMVLEEKMSGEAIDEMVDLEYLADNVRDEMNNARAWLDGEYEDYPSLVDAWKELVR